MNNYIEHHGILGQKWGVRRYQNPDGSYTAAGKKHRDINDYYNKDKAVVSSGRTKRLEKKIDKMNAIKKNNVDSFNSITEDLKYSRGKRKGQTFYSVEDAKRDQKITADIWDARIKKTKQKLDISKQRDIFNSQAKFRELLTYNEATRKKAAQYVVKNNMSYEDAVRRIP